MKPISCRPVKIIQSLFDISPGKHHLVLNFGVFYALFLINGVNSQCNGCANGHIENGSDCYNLINDRIYACRGEWSLPGISSIGYNSASLTCASNFEGVQVDDLFCCFIVFGCTLY